MTLLQTILVGMLSGAAGGFTVLVVAAMITRGLT